MVRPCSTFGEEKSACRVWVGKSEGTRQLGKPRCRWEDNIKMDLENVDQAGSGLGQMEGSFDAIINLRFQ
jgi:hypothetical protein